MKSLLDDVKLKALNSRGGSRRTNVRLVEAIPLLRPLELGHLTLRCIHLHVGAGVYKTGKDSGKHRHSELQLEYVLDGEFRFTVAGKGVLLKPGRGLFITPETLHSWVCLSRGSMFGAIIETTKRDQNELQERLERSYRGRKLGFDSPLAAKIAPELISRLVSTSQDIWLREEIIAMVDQWFLACFRAQLKAMRWKPSLAKTATPSRSKELAEKTMDFIEANYSHPLTLESVAVYTGVCAKHANRVFHQHYHASIINTVMRIRMNRAMEMLQSDPTCPIKAVASNVGFRSSSYFNRCFTRAFGMTPKEARSGQEQ